MLNVQDKSIGNFLADNSSDYGTAKDIGIIRHPKNVQNSFFLLIGTNRMKRLLRY